MHKTTLTEALQFQIPLDKGIVLLKIPTHIATVQEVCITQDMKT